MTTETKLTPETLAAIKALGSVELDSYRMGDTVGWNLLNRHGREIGSFGLRSKTEEAPEFLTALVALINDGPAEIERLREENERLKQEANMS